MGLETGTFVEDLVITNPPGVDVKAQGDDHIRLVKKALRNSFKRATRAFYFPTSVTKTSDYTVLASDENTTIYVDTTAGDVVITPPSTAELGFQVKLIKSSADNNAIVIQPATGFINQLYNRIRRSAPHTITELTWVGSWVATRGHGLTCGAMVPFHGPTLPPGYLWADGSAYDPNKYQELFVAYTVSTVADLRGRIPVGRDNMGVGAANRVTSAGSGITGTDIGAPGGAETITLATGQIPSHTHNGSTGNGGAFNTGAIGSTGASVDHVHIADTGNDTPDHVHESGDLFDALNTDVINYTAGAASKTFVNVVNNTASGFTAGANVRHQHPVLTGGMRTAGGAAPSDHTHNIVVAVADHTHTVAVTAQPGTKDQPHSNMPPVIVTNYIVLAE